MSLHGNRIFHVNGISQRTYVHPFTFRRYERLEDIKYPRRYPPPPGHPLQCQGLIVSTFTQCDRWAQRTIPYCKICRKLRPVTSLYKEHAGKTLKALLTQAEEGAPADRLSVIAEIDMARVACVEAVRLFSIVLENPKTDAETRATSVSLLHSALREVRDMVKAQSSILTNVEGLITQEQYLYMAETMKKLVMDAFPDSVKSEKVCEAIDMLQLPSKPLAEKVIAVTLR